jgi:hypothetical protein
LHQNILRDAIQRLSDLAVIRSDLKACGLDEPSGEPFHRVRAHDFHLVRPCRGQPEDVSASLGVAGGGEAVEGRLEDLPWHPDVVGDVAEPGLACGLSEPEDLQQRPQPADVELASRTFRDRAQLRPGALANQPADGVLQQLVR